MTPLKNQRLCDYLNNESSLKADPLCIRHNILLSDKQCNILFTVEWKKQEVKNKNSKEERMDMIKNQCTQLHCV